MYKGLITSGCSFSLYDISHNKHGWPYFLQHKLVQDGYLSKDYTSYHRGLGSNGNMLIARNAYEGISKLLNKGIKGEEILCVVEWSAVNRYQYFLERAYSYFDSETNSYEKAYHHDVGIKFEGGEYKPLVANYKDGYILLNAQHEDDNTEIPQYTRDMAKLYFKHFQNVTNDVINSLWNWITLQNYCEINNVKPYYTFMFEHDKGLLLKDELGKEWAWKYLQDDIIRDNIIDSITEFLENYKDTSKSYAFNKRKLAGELLPGDGHPSQLGHKIFTDKCLYPFIKKGLTST